MCCNFYETSCKLSNKHVLIRAKMHKCGKKVKRICAHNPVTESDTKHAVGVGPTPNECSEPDFVQPKRIGQEEVLTEFICFSSYISSNIGREIFLMLENGGEIEPLSKFSSVTSPAKASAAKRRK